MGKLNNKKSVLELDLRATENIMSDWKREREKKSNIFNSYGEYIEFLEQRLELEDDIYKKYFIEREIKKLKKEQKKYYVPSVLEMARFDFVQSRDISKTSLEKASFPIVKKVRTRSRYNN